MKFLWRGLMSLWVRAEVRPDDALRQIVAATAAPVCYVLERRSTADVAFNELRSFGLCLCVTFNCHVAQNQNSILQPSA